jgi:chaperone modulatory protein CbpM
MTPGTTLARPARLSLAGFSRAARIHPELVVRLVGLGLIDAVPDTRGRLTFAPSEVARAARIQRLHSGLSLNYAAIGLVLDLLERIDVLEAALHRSNRWI